MGRGGDRNQGTNVEKLARGYLKRHRCCLFRLVCILVTPGDDLTFLNVIYLGVHTCPSGNWEQDFLGRALEDPDYSFLMKQKLESLDL